ncbi:flippase-like domain-containing protein [bacterium]|nr:flippase-like domain-containing protein [candidate division CSSED10-310 bacterium]
MADKSRIGWIAVRDYLWQFVKKILPLILLLLIARYIARDWSRILDILHNISRPWMSLSLICYLAGVTLIGWNWVTVLRLLGTECGLLGGFRSYFYSMLVKYIPGRIWGAAGRIMFARQAGIPEGTSALGIIMESLLLMCSAAIVGFFLIGTFHSLPVEVRVLMLTSPLLIILLHPLIIHHGVQFLGKRFPKYVVEMSRIPGTGSICMLLIRYCFVWIFQGVGFWCALKAMVDFSPRYMLMCIGGNTLAWLAGFLIVLTPAGLGVREIIITRLTYGIIGEGPAAMIALISRIAVIVCELAGSAVISVIFFIHSRRVRG